MWTIILVEKLGGCLLDINAVAVKPLTTAIA
jgi:hypothetical protein